MKRIAVIEDQPDNLEMLTGLLELESYEVAGAATGEDGLDLILETRS